MPDNVLDIFRDESFAPDKLLAEDTDGQEETEVPEESTEEQEPAEESTDTTEDEAPAEEAQAEETEEVADDAVSFVGGKFKTAEDLEKAYTNLQSLKDREIAEIKAKVDAYESLINAPQAQPEAPQANVQVTEEELIAGVEAAPGDVFQWAMYNNPELIPGIISLTREKHGHTTADQMQSVYTNAMVQAQQLQMQEQIQQLVQPQMVQSNLTSALSHVKETYGEDFDLLKDDVAEMLKNHGQLESTDPEYVATVLEHYFLKAYRENAMSNKKAPQRTEPAKAPVQSASPGAEPPEASIEDEFLQQIVDAQKRNSYF